MSSASSAVTYTSVYTNSEPGRVFWGADEEILDGGIPRVIVYEYDGLPMQAYIPLEDEHVFLVEEQPLPPVDSPTAESPGYVSESDPEEDLEEYEDDETEDGLVDYSMDEGDDGDDDDGDSSRDDADDEDEDEEDKEEEQEAEHLALADSAIVVPTVEPVSPPKGTDAVIPPPSTDITTTGSRIIVRGAACLGATTILHIHHHHWCHHHYTTISWVSNPNLDTRIASTQALIDVVTATLQHLHYHHYTISIHTTLPVDRGMMVLESELLPR
ncbi:hypothetical protein Tco_0273100 [Tanacetum coccineum]